MTPAWDRGRRLPTSPATSERRGLVHLRPCTARACRQTTDEACVNAHGCRVRDADSARKVPTRPHRCRMELPRVATDVTLAPWRVRRVAATTPRCGAHD